MQALSTALRATAVTLVLTGLIYPLAITGLAQLMFPEAADGSLVQDGGGRVVGSALLGQGFEGAGYFQARPSAAGSGWDAAASSGSNLSTTSEKLRDRVVGGAAQLHRANPEAQGPVPDELVTTSGSGLDPHISPDTARWQAPRVARARGVDVARIRAVIGANTEGRDLGFLGEPRVNVLLLNLALDRQFGGPPSPTAATDAP